MAEKEKSDLIEKVIEVKRVSKVVKGGRRFSFSALVVVGDGKGRVGTGLGKANEVIEAVRKGTEKAQKAMNAYSLYKNSIPHHVIGKHGAAKVLMKPSQPGSGIISSGAVRAVVEAIGIKDINAKALGSANVNNLVQATVNGLKQLKSFGEVAERRNKTTEEVCLIDF
ncbi:MAG: 30S ribosomal protein S5 [Deltaproteobacteria bacterium]|mgnify:CR=1 FL=1|nr:30S ribosomal protein S5 [Deltaproteobacteria bacterium]MBT4266376.1 30S ribosomal protein S5 [Deltaproteobacteria bacterium]MBT4643940.1 30S ribosomal protein S5 [Deltaproteobacteria bacterium]MBT6502108.1 30S ribosomal protein S5 [Deltaproteobacteria bacterium]MBT6610872.1 30S ribosomal protein S5 [Deltaproteobacteria bacterium]